MTDADIATLADTFSYAQARAAGLTKHRLYQLRDSGSIEHIERGAGRPHRRRFTGISSIQTRSRSVGRRSRSTTTFASACGEPESWQPAELIITSGVSALRRGRVIA